MSTPTAPHADIADRLAAGHGIIVCSFVPGRLRLRAPAKRWPGLCDDLRALVARGVAVSVSPNPITCTILVHYDACSYSQPAFLAAVEGGLSARADYEPASDAQTPAASPATGHARHGWTVISHTPGRIRLSHPLLAHYPLFEQAVKKELFQLAGITHYDVSLVTSNVLLKYKRHVLTEDEILGRLDGVVARTEAEIRNSQPAAVALDRTTLRFSLSSLAMLAAGAAKFIPALRPIALLGTLAAATPIFVSAAQAVVVERAIKVDILDATVIGLSLGYGYLAASAFMVWVVNIGDVLLDSATRHSKHLMTEIFSNQVRVATMLVGGNEVAIEVEALALDDVVVVKTGEQIPVDGIILAGDALVDQHALTGESAPVERSPGDTVFGMTAVLSGTVHIQAMSTGSNTRAAQIVQILERAIEHRPKLQLTSERFADRMVVPTLGLGALGRVIQGPSAMLAVINADYGTGIRIAGPLALISSLAVAARNGVVIKNGGILESIHEMDAVVFDKTGTLTDEVPHVGAIVALDSAFTEEQILTVAAAAEQSFSHPIARAIKQHAARMGLSLPDVDDSEYVVGFGINIRIAGDRVKVGSLRFMKQEKVRLQHGIAGQLDEIYARGSSAVFVAVNQRLAGVIELRPSARVEARGVVQLLRDRGIEHIYLISGDHELPTRALAKSLGIDRYFSEVLPEDKAQHVRSLQERGFKVGMVGDGINDSIALSQADFSISLQGAAHIATDVADVVFMSGDLTRFALLLELSDQLRANLKRSIAMTVVPNSVCITGALIGVFGFGMSLVLNNVFNVAAIANGMLPQFSEVGAPENE